MGEVYRARDTKLGRDVAIKILPTSVAADPERVARLEREARVLATLSHPNIAHVYGLEGAAIVMELVDGETLADRIRRGPLKVAEALAIARQIADALDAAHEKGIVHRDLKPSNVAFTGDGVVKVLDFGLAKDDTALAVGATALTHSPTMLGATGSGVLLGTAPYMSPEQARGKAVDKRADIWAFGCVLFEMLTGKRAFDGDTTTDVLAAILDRDPDWNAVPSAAAPLRPLLEQCLHKDPRRRLRDIADARLSISTERTAEPVVSQARFGWVALLASALAGGIGVSAVLALNTPTVDPTKFTFRPLAAQSTVERSPAWSSDGRNLAYVAEIGGIPQVFVMSLAAAVPQRVTEVAAGAANPFFSVDGSHVYFMSSGDLWSAGTAGGSPVAVEKNVARATVAGDGTLAFVRGTGGSQSLWIRRPGDSAAVQYSTAPFPRVFTRATDVQFSRDGAVIAVLMEQQDDQQFRQQLWLVPLPSGEPRMMPEAAHLSASRSFVDRRLSWEPDNRHVVVSSQEPGSSRLHLFRLDVKQGSIEQITSGVSEEMTPAVSPDGRRIAYASGGVDFDIIEGVLATGQTRSLLTGPRSDRFPISLAGTSRFAYVTDMRGGDEIWMRREGEYWPTPVVVRDPDTPAQWLSLERPAISRDGTRLAYGVNENSRHAVWISPLAGGTPVRLDDSSIDQHGAAWSPDSNWIAYQRMSAGSWNLVKRPVSGGASIVLAQATPGGGPTSWSSSGEWIAFSGARGLEVVTPDASTHKLLSGPVVAFEFMQDGQRIAGVRRAPDRKWELFVINVRTAAETAVALDISPTVTIAGLSVDQSQTRVELGVGTAKWHLWLVDGLRTRAQWFQLFFAPQPVTPR